MKSNFERNARILPGDIPRYVRIYDNGGKSLDNYTVVFTRNSQYHEGYGREYHNLTMNSAPFHPQGICMSGSSGKIIDRPTYSHLGKRIKFTDLNGDCQKAVLQDYQAIWNL